jgi:hypothetical protein
MATTEAGGIVPEELRERLIALFSWMNEVPIDSGSDVAVADDVLAEIAAAGYELVERQRLRDVAFNYELAATCVHDAGTVRAWERDERVLKAWIGEGRE